MRLCARADWAGGAPLSEHRAEIMEAVGDALEAERLGRTRTTRCPVCEGVLAVEKLPDLGITYVSCGSRCTEFRMRYRSRPSEEE